MNCSQWSILDAKKNNLQRALFQDSEPVGVCDVTVTSGGLQAQKIGQDWICSEDWPFPFSFPTFHCPPSYFQKVFYCFPSPVLFRIFPFFPLTLTSRFFPFSHPYIQKVFHCPPPPLSNGRLRIFIVETLCQAALFTFLSLHLVRR